MSPATSFSFFSVLLAKSKPPPPPGVLGVFPEDPNDAKAPEPSPNAEDALAEGEFVVNGDIAFSGFDFPASLPKRRVEKLRGESDLPPSLPSVLLTESDNLPVLQTNG